MIAIRMRRTVALLTLGVVHASVLTAQTVRDTAQTDTTRKRQVLFTAGDAALGAAFVGLTIAMFPADRSIAQRLENENSKANKFFDRSATGLELISTPGAFIVGPALYAFGRYTHHPDIEDLGWHGT
ncbi:MAG TPA: hypothetical protein VNR63_03615, partial [Gaiellaceae bacterium]|nr:hypothetical protein [Gaiellaceae bacterium]